MGIEFSPLTLVAPRQLPAGWALYYGDHHCEGVYDAFRVVRAPDGGTVGVERPWGFFDERPGYTDSFEVSPSGETLAVLACEQGFCESRHTSPSEDALLALWVSRDGGQTWNREGETPQRTLIWAVSDEDVALARPAYDPEQWPEYRAWWFHSGREVMIPEELGRGYVVGLYETEVGLEPIWKRDSEPVYVLASGTPLTQPLADHSGGADVEWWLTTVLPDGSLLWSLIEWGKGRGNSDLFAITDQAGAVRDMYSWEDARKPLLIIDHLHADLFVAAFGVNICGDMRETVLVDLGTRSVHPITGGLGEARRQNSPFGGGLLLGVRPAPGK